MLFLVYLFFVIFSNGIGAFQQTQMRSPIYYDPQIIDPSGNRNPDELHAADYQAVIRAALKAKFPEVEGRAASRELTRLVSGSAAFVLQKRVTENPALIGTTETRWLVASDAVDLLQKGHIDRAIPEAERPLSDQQLAWTDKLRRRRRARAQVQQDIRDRRRFARTRERRHLGRGGRVRSSCWC